jgi:osmotically-inducible protein OsmY
MGGERLDAVTQKFLVSLCLLVMLALITSSVAQRALAQDKGAGFNDAVIGELVKTALYNDAVLRSMDISVDVRDRVVHLRGFVSTMSEVGRAEALARGIEGVTGVRNTIRVANRPSRA